ncbi:MAG: hypothetical protein C4554_08190 [Dethiobacter sp.]|nr:MAG: hypothetical protein C4554_08190 [Dethiobacter sp.]
MVIALLKYKFVYPGTDVIFVRTNWGGSGGFYFIPVSVQEEGFQKLRKEGYIQGLLKE